MRVLKAIAKESGKSIPEQEPSYPKTKNNYKASTQSAMVGPILVPGRKNDSKISSTHVEPLQILTTDSGVLCLPEASFVMKVKRSDGVKYFINVTDHDDVPNGRIVTSTAAAKESIAKDGTTCHVYDVCLNRSFLHAILVDQTAVSDPLREQVAQICFYVHEMYTYFMFVVML